MTLEEAPPESLGGSKLALTCKKCNSECGHNIDNHLTEIIRAIDRCYFYKGSKHYGNIDHNGKRISVELTSLGDGIFQAHHRIKQNNPTLLENFIYWIKDKNIGSALNFTQHQPKFESKKVHFALLKVLYITTFSKFGYIFLLDSKYDDIRKQLLNPDEEIFLWKPFINDPSLSNQQGTYYIVNKGIESIFNVFSLKSEYSETIIGGLLPISIIGMKDFVDGINSFSDNGNGISLNAKHYDPDADLFGNILEINKILLWINNAKKSI